MSKAFPITKIPSLVLSGIDRASNNFMNASDGWLWRAPEYWVTTHIALELAKKIDAAKRVVWLEHGIQKTITRAGARNRGPVPRHLDGLKRFDIALGFANTSPRCIVEVKSPVFTVASKACVRDIDRLAKTLSSGNGNSSLQSAIFAFYTDCAAPARKHDTAKAKLTERFGKDGLYHMKVKAHLEKFHPDVRPIWHEGKVYSATEFGARMAVVLELRRI